MMLVPAFFMLGGGELLVPLMRFIVKALYGFNKVIPENIISIGQSAYQNTNIDMPATLHMINNFITKTENSSLGYEQAVPYIILLWVIGVLIFFIFRAKCYYGFKNMVSKNSKRFYKEDCIVNLFKSDYVMSPILIGIFKPIIVLPNREISEKELNIILKHELEHLRRKDLILKLIILIVNGVHWFNPLAYSLNAKFDILCENSCDERVALKMDFSERRVYGQTILSMLEYSKIQNKSLYTGFSRSRNHLKRRLSIIMQTKKSKPITILISTLVAVMVITIGASAVYAVSPKESEKTLSPDIEAASNSSLPDDETSSVTEEKDTSSTVQTFIKPVEYNRISAEFGSRYLADTKVFHDGVDLAADNGKEIIAPMDGTVIVTNFYTQSEILSSDIQIPYKLGPSYGRSLVIDHGNGYRTLYAHCSDVLVKVGDEVKQGDVIAMVGSTGRSTGNHLHFEIWENDIRVNPMDYIK